MTQESTVVPEEAIPRLVPGSAKEAFHVEWSVNHGSPNPSRQGLDDLRKNEAHRFTIDLVALVGS